MHKLSKLGLPLLPLAAVALAGCGGTIMDKINNVSQIDYKSEAKQRQLPPLEIPPDLKSPGRDDRFSIPNDPNSTATGTATLSQFNSTRGAAKTVASASGVLPGVQNVSMERAGSQRWLVVQAPPDQLWPIVKEFWQESGFLINIDQPDTGVMETDWAENRAKIPQGFIRNTIGKVFDDAFSTGERDKFRTRLEKGSRPGTTEIYISHRGMVEVVLSGSAVGATTWQARPSDPELEAEFLARLTEHLGVDENAAHALVAGDTKIPDRARLVKAADGANAVQVQEPFDRAWRRVGLALDRVGFTVEDRDRSKGYYYVRYVDPEADARSKKDDGFLSKLAFWRSNDPAKAAQYRIQVKDGNDTSEVKVLNKDGATDSSDTARRILALLQAQLR